MSAKGQVKLVYDRLFSRLASCMLENFRIELASRDAEQNARLARLEGKLDHAIAGYANVEQFIYSLNKPMAQKLRDETKVTKLIAETSEGEFVFDVADEVLGWNMALGGWEPAETAFVKSILRTGDLVIDAGANLGWYSVVAAKAVGDKGLVLAFEPDDRNFELLSTNVSLHGVQHRVSAQKIALFERDDQVVLKRSDNNFGDHRIESIPTDRQPAHAIPARRLDQVLTELNISERAIRLLKLDTQGSEISILKGALAALDRTEYVMIEFCPAAFERSGNNPNEFNEIAKSKFSKFARLSSGSIEFRPIKEIDADTASPMDISSHSPSEAHTNYVLSK